jgi:Neuraminidase (sialidase)
MAASISSSASPQELPKAPKVEVITVTPKPGFFTEPSIAVNPNKPEQVVAAFQDNAHIAYSVDAGHNWQLATGVEPLNYRVSGDVSVTFDNEGRAFICYIAFNKLGTFNYWGHNSSRNGIYVRRSLDGGATWETQDVAATEQPDQSTVPWEDKPYIVADTGRGPYAGNLYIGWTRWTLTDSEMLFVRSTDHGKTWSKPIEIDNSPGLPRDDNGAIEGFAGAVGPDGALYALWTDGNHVVLTTSHDGGRTFSRTRNIIDTAPTMFTIQAVARTNGFAEIAIDPSGGPKGGPLYVTWSDYRNGDVDVFCSTSADHGKTWSPARRVNDDPIHNGADQFFQWMAVDPTDGSAYVLFYDRRGDPKNHQQIVVLARSTDGGRTFQNYAWTDQPFDAQGVFMGDYTGLTALNGRVYGVWTEKPENKSSRDTTIRIGVADFNAEKASKSAP